MTVITDGLSLSNQLISPRLLVTNYFVPYWFYLKIKRDLPGS